MTPARSAASFAFVLGASSAVGANARATEHAWPPLARLEDHVAERRFSLSLGTRAGLMTAPFVTTAFPQVSGFGTVLTAAAAVQVSAVGWLRVRLPVAFVRLDFPAGAQVGEAAFGNLELGLEHQLELQPDTHLALLATALAPSAEHGSGPALLDNRALAVASALNAGVDSPLFTPGVIGLRVGLSVEHSRPPFELRAAIDLPVLLRVSDASLPAETETHMGGITPKVDARAAVRLTRWFGVSFGAGLVTEPLRVQEPAFQRARNQRVQALIEPGVLVRLGQHVALGLDSNIPVGGALGGNGFSVNVSARVKW